MHELILHIGRAKTGTTTWQEMVSLNREQLQLAGVTIPNFFHGNNHGELAVAFSARPGRLGRSLAVESREDQVKLQGKLQKKLERELTEGTWLFTSEHFSTRLRTAGEVDELYAFLGGHFDRIKVFAYVRRPDDLAPSAFAETIKAGRTHGFNPKYAMSARAFFDHAAFVQLWERPLHPEITFTLRPYLRGGHLDDMWRTLFALAAVRTPLPQLVAPPALANESLSAAALRFLQEVNPLVPDGALTHRNRRTLIATLASAQGVGLLLAPNVAAALGDQELLTGGLSESDFAEDLRWGAWFASPPAVTGDWPRLSEYERAEFVDRCEAAGVTFSSESVDATHNSDDALRAIRRAAVRLKQR
ncbi:MAG: hypothetical protein EXQ60_06105 [Candidatus Nanopelagicales bacterium]|nr:hypothetical protein [Candidatus Nanopelagicales bacterium]